MDITGFASVTAITIICWLIGEVFSNLSIDNKWIPSIVGGFGALLGVVGWLLMENFPANDVLTAFAVGIVSGLASTGADQIWKQTHPSDKGRIVFPANEEAEEEEDDSVIPLDSEETAGAENSGFLRSLHPVEMTDDGADLRSCFAQGDKPSDGEDEV